jgi:hypothetical protein
MNSFTIISNTQAGNFQKDGAYVDLQSPQPNLPAGQETGLVVVVGTGSRGKKNVLLPFTDDVSAALTIGMKTTLNKSALREALSAMPECSTFGAVRVSDGTDVEAVLNILDASAGIVLVGTAVDSGSDLNLASARVDLQSGTPTAAPVYVITVFAPGRNPIAYRDIIGYSAPGGAYSATAFQANALAVLNGTAPNSTANPDFVFTAGASILAPDTGQVFQASGGTDGDSGVTDAITQGTDAGVDSTGMYVLRKQVAGAQLVLADFTTTADFANVAAFAFEEGAFAFATFAAGTPTATAVSTKATNNMSSDNMAVVMDWDQVYDTYQGNAILVSPIGKIAGVIASLPAFQYPGNNPPRGVQGVTTTERLELGSIPDSEAAQRQSNGILYLGLTPNGVLGLPHGLTSSGVQINVVRMRNYIANGVGQIMGRFVSGMLETNLPIAQADENDPRVQCQAALNQWLGTLATAGQRQIAAYQVVINDTNNTSATMEDGFLIAQIFVTTLTGVQFSLAVVQVGNTVQIQTAPLAA